MARLQNTTALRSLCLLLTALLGIGCDTTDPDDEPEVTVIDLVVGTGDEAVRGARIAVHYVGKLTSGQTFDASRPPDSATGGQPYSFTLGAGTVIEGWERGIPGMRVGGKRRLVVPPQLAYGSRGVCRDGVCPIPPNTTLVFDIDLLDVVAPRASSSP